VKQRHRRSEVGVEEVQVELGEVGRKQHALEDDGPRRHRHDVEVLERLQVLVPQGVVRLLAQHVELAFERVGIRRFRSALDEHLADVGLPAPHGVAEHAVIDRYPAPADQNLALAADGGLDRLDRQVASRRIAWQEDHADGVVSQRRQRQSPFGHGPAQEPVRQLDQDPGAVASKGIRSDGAAMIEVVHDLESLVDQVVAGLVADVGDEPEPAGVMFLRGIVHPLRRRKPVP